MELSRRGMVIAGALTASGVAPPLRAAPPGARFSSVYGSPYALMNAKPAAVAQNFSRSKWVAAKAVLLSDYQFLAPFADNACVDGIIYRETSNLAPEIPPYDPYQVETLAASTSDLLNRCLSNRRDMYDIEEQAIRRALEYKLYKDQRSAQLAIELASWIEVQKKTEGIGQAKAAVHFGQGTDALSAGFRDVSSTAADSANKVMNAEILRKQNVTSKWAAMDEFQGALEDRHNTPGCALNFAERYGRLEQLLVQDVRIAYAKLRCIEVGLKAIFGLSIPMPAPQEYGYLDEMVMYLRTALEAASIATINEIEFDHVVSLRQQRSSKLDLSGASPLISNADWTAAINGSGVLRFKLDNEFSSAITHIRIRGIGMSVTFNNADDDTFPQSRDKGSSQHLRSVTAIVMPPQVDNLFVNGAVMNRPPVVIGASSWFDPVSFKTTSLPAVSNIDPSKGTWQIQLAPNVLTDSASADRVSEIKDVRLHLRLGATLVDRNLSAFPWSAPIY
jgi:hypothetical protein